MSGPLTPADASRQNCLLRSQPMASRSADVTLGSCSGRHVPAWCLRRAEWPGGRAVSGVPHEALNGSARLGPAFRLSDRSRQRTRSARSTPPSVYCPMRKIIALDFVV